jgi:hypothetical protein
MVYTQWKGATAHRDEFYNALKGLHPVAMCFPV